MAYKYDIWCSRNKDKPFKKHDLTKVDGVAGNGCFGFRVHLDERTALERRKEKYGEFNPRSRKHKPSCRRNLCHTTSKDPTVNSNVERAIAFQEWLVNNPVSLLSKYDTYKPKLSRKQRRKKREKSP